MVNGPILKLKGIVKQFPGVTALKNVDFEVSPGEVRVLIGENGAGKSTLAKIILGAQLPSAGDIFFNGDKVNFRSPLDARNAGIGGVHQELMLVPWLNVAQNIFLNREPLKHGTIEFKTMHEQSKKLLNDLGIDLDTTLPIKRLSTANQQMIEICKTLSLNTKFIIFDEPTASLSEKETELLFKKIIELKKKGVAIIYVSHRLQEMRKIGDTVTVLRDGEHIGTYNLNEVSNDELVTLMVGRTIEQMYHRNRCVPGEELIRLENLTVEHGPENVNLVIRRGELVGLCGLVGAGRSELAQAIFGIRKILSGSIYLNGKKIVPKSPWQMSDTGVGLIPEDRKQAGLALRLSVGKNLVIVILRKIFKIFVKDLLLKSIVQKSIEEFRIATPNERKMVGALSGGNQQKLVLAKWLNMKSDFYIFDEPTRGIDVGAKVEVHNLMDALVNQGKGILMISSDFPEMLGMSDRIYTIYSGKITGRYDDIKNTCDEIAPAMLGVGGNLDGSH